MRKPLLVLLLGGSLILGSGATVARAAPGHPGSPIQTVPPLRIGFGPVSISEDTTTPNGMVGSPDGCGGAEGAAAYRITLDEPAKLAVTIAEIDADGICAVGLYDATRNGDSLESLYDRSHRAAFAVTETMCASSCQISRRLGADSYYLVVWPTGEGSVSRAFSIVGQIRGFAQVLGTLSGRSIGMCRQIDRGEQSAVSIQMSPAPAAGTAVSVRVFPRPDGDPQVLEPIILDEQGRGTGSVPAGRRGYKDVVIRFAGSETREPARMVKCLITRGPSKVTIEARGWRYQYDDYGVYKHGDRIIYRVEVGPPSAANGKINLRIERNIGNHKYEPFTVIKGILVKHGLAVYRMRAIYRSNGLPFYRIRAEWRGSPTYAPNKSHWICVQVDR